MEIPRTIAKISLELFFRTVSKEHRVEKVKEHILNFF